MRLLNTSTGQFWLHAEGGKLVKCGWLDGFGQQPDDGYVETPEDSKTLDLAEKELTEYFNGKRTKFTVPFGFTKGTEYQQKVWKTIAEVPYGVTVTYGDIAKHLDSGPRAVGGATGKNPLPIFIPCHRVMGASGKLTGFSGGEGVSTKVKLLHFENVDGSKFSA